MYSKYSDYKTLSLDTNGNFVTISSKRAVVVRLSIYSTLKDCMTPCNNIQYTYCITIHIVLIYTYL